METSVESESGGILLPAIRHERGESSAAESDDVEEWIQSDFSACL